MDINNNIKILDSRDYYSLMTLVGTDNKEILRFERNGDIFIHGNLITNDMEVVDGFKEFLVQRGLIS